MTTLDLKFIYIYAFNALHPTHLSPQRQVLAKRSRFNKAFERLYALFMQHDMLASAVTVKAFFYYTLSMHKPLTPQELTHEIYFLRFLQHGRRIGEQLMRQHEPQ